jgi:hypothetical protein
VLGSVQRFRTVSNKSFLDRGTVRRGGLGVGSILRFASELKSMLLEGETALGLDGEKVFSLEYYGSSKEKEASSSCSRRVADSARRLRASASEGGKGIEDFKTFWRFTFRLFPAAHLSGFGNEIT